MKTRLNGILTLLLALLVQVSFAQEKTVSGTVSDKSGPLPGVSVLVKGSSIGTETDFDGKYSIKAKVGNVLTFSFIGYKTINKKIGLSNTINITMEEDTNVLDEVVVVGYGTGRKVSSVVGAIKTVNAKQLEDKPTPNVLDGLQGKVAGLQIFTSSGEPSATSSFRIHGVGSLGASSTPLVVLDGIPTDSGTLVSLNPNDFESVTVLKDASATSIYGSRAANGVIYIVTKQGRRNQDATVTIRSQYGVSNLANTDFYESLMNSKQLSDFWVATGYAPQSYVDNLLAQYPNDTKWYKTYYKSNQATVQEDISISGGGEKTSYFISAGYLKQDGLAYRSDFERYNFRSNIDSKVKKWLRVGVRLSMGYDDRQTNPYGSNSTNRGLAFLAQPWFSPVDANGDRYDLIPGWGRYHPEYLAEKIKSTGKNLQFNPSGYISITPMENLTFKSQAGMDFYDYTTSNKSLPSFLGNAGSGSASESFSRGSTLTVTNTLEYKFNLQNTHDFTALIGHEFIDYNYRYFNASSAGQSDDRLMELDAGTTNINVSQSTSQYVYESYFGRLEYNFDQKYYADVSVRQDGSSRFGKDNRKATFWSIGGMWKAKKESFLKDVNWLDNLDVRLSYGTSGNSSIGNYQSLATVGTNQYDSSGGYSISSPGNSGLTWEQQTKLSLNANFSIFNRFRFDVGLYNRNTSSMLISVPTPYTTGFSSIISNVGTLNNRGLDFELNFDVFKNRDFYVTPYLSFNYNQQKVTKLFQGKDYWIIPNTGVAWAVGKPVTYFYPIHAGVNPQTGYSEWYLPGADITSPHKDKSQVTNVFNSANLEQSTGIKRNPPLNGGFGFSAGYKGLTLEANFSFSLGKYLINNDRYFSENPNVFTGYNQSKRVIDYWKQPGDVTTFPGYNKSQFTQFDSTLIEDASFVRLKTLTLGYNLPKEISGKAGFKNLRLYLVGRNLLTFTDYLGPDPEVDSNLTLGANPNTKQVSLGLEIQF